MVSDIRIIDKINNANEFIDKTYFGNLDECEIREVEDYKKRYNLSRIFQITKIVYDMSEDINDKLISVFNSIVPFCKNLVFIVKGSKEETTIYLGIKSRQIGETQISSEILHDAFLGNFPGSNLVPLKTGEISEQIFYEYDLNKSNVSYINIIPTERQTNSEAYIQGLEKFIDTMRGSEYICEIIASPINEDEINNRLAGFEELYSALYPFSKKTSSHGHNLGKTLTEGINESISESISKGINRAIGRSDSHSNGKNQSVNMGMHMLLSFGVSEGTNEGWTTGSNESDGFSSGNTRGETYGKNTSTALSNGTTDNLTLEFKDKGIEELLEKINAHIKRLKTGNSFGIWEVGSFFISEDRKNAAVAANTYRSILIGDDTGIEKAHFVFFDQINSNTAKICEFLKYFEHPEFVIKDNYDNETKMVTATSYINGKELVKLVNMPRKSVNGVMVSEMAEFGRNTYDIDSCKNKIELGHLYHMGMIDNNKVCLDLETMSSHCFVTGTTGSGKSNTIYKMIESLIERDDVSFLVIEPAKGEYRNMFRNVPNINLFTTNPYIDQMLKLNPFSFCDGIHILEHLDRIVEIINGCWEMYAAMPAILKDAIEQAYINKGWDLLNSIYMNEGEKQYPTFLDVLVELPKVISKSDYSSETKGDYIGALVTRVNSMTNGIYGQIFCDDYEIQEEDLFNCNTIIDLCRVGSSEAKSLIMGVLVLKLSEFRFSEKKNANEKLKHVTIIEEAHNILKNTKNISEGIGSRVVAKSVEMIVNSIAEMRSYGEGFVIVDQSPASVDIAAIKNTNTKILMRLPEEEDRYIAGKSVSLNDKQVLELAKLGTGIAVVMQNNWQEPILTKIEKAKGSYIDNEILIEYEKLKEFRSMVVKEIINEYELNDSQNLKKILYKIEEFDIVNSKKKEAVRFVKKIDGVLSQKFNSIYFGKAILRFIGFTDALKRAEKLIKFEVDEQGNKGDLYSKSSLYKWDTLIRSDINNYLSVDEQYQSIVRQYIIHSMKFEKHGIDYSLLYRQLYSNLK